MTKRKIGLISFRLYPEGRFLYCHVNIWPTKKAMREYLPLSPKTVASCGGRECYDFRKGKQPRKRGLFAEANFYRGAIGIEVVSHELTHGAFAFAERRKLRLDQAMSKEFRLGGKCSTMDIDGPEERFCYALGQMCRQFTQKCYDLGLYRDVVQSK